MSASRLPLSSRPSFLPDEISRREFATVFRGYDQMEVRTFLNQLAEQAAETADRVAEIQRAMTESEERAKNPELDEEMVTKLLGEQTAQILRSAREAANDIRGKAEEEVSRSLREAHEVTTRMREEAEALLAERTDEAERMAEVVRTDAAQSAEKMRSEASEAAATIRSEVADEAARDRAATEGELLHLRQQTQSDLVDERARARQQARELIDIARAESQALVERTQAKQTELLEGLVRKRKIALAQVEELRAGRQRLLKAYKMVRGTLDDITAELTRVEDEARQAAEESGTRAAEGNGIAHDDLDTVVELEKFELNDDVSQMVIDLVESEEGAATEDGAPLKEEDSPPEEQSPAGSTDSPMSGAESSDASGSATQSMSSATAVMEERQQRNDQEVPELWSTQSTSRDNTDIDLTENMPETQGEKTLVNEPSSVSSGLIIGESYAAGLEEMDRSLKLRRDAVVGKARSQAIRRLKRALQDEQDALVGRLRSGTVQSVEELLGSADDQSASYHRAVVKLFREVVRTGASSVEGSTGVERGVIDHTGTTAARGLASELVTDLRGQLQPVLANLLATEPMPVVDEIQQRIAEPYRTVKGDYLDQLVDDRIGGVFDQGVAFARN